YPGVMVGVTALIAGFMIGQLDSHFSTGLHFSAGVPSPLFMIIFCIFFSFGVAYIAFRGVGGTTGVNAAINVIQITALIIFSVMAIGYRVKHPDGATNGWALLADKDGNQRAYAHQQATRPATAEELAKDANTK